jgi:hypothetical protein
MTMPFRLDSVGALSELNDGRATRNSHRGPRQNVQIEENALASNRFWSPFLTFAHSSPKFG